jgi:hypothetical protein
MNEEIDKTSTTYFMTQMTQKEFEELLKYRPPNKYEFNKINIEIMFSKENQSLTNECLNPLADNTK